MELNLRDAQLLRWAQRRANKAMKTRWLSYRPRPSAPPHISPAETRDELIVNARRELDLLRALRGGPHERSRSESREILRKVGYLRSFAALRPRVDAADIVFYVSIRSGERYGLLYGPFDSQIEALRALPLARATAQEQNSDEAAFASFGTCSVSRENAKPGRLNAYLPPITLLAA